MALGLRGRLLLAEFSTWRPMFCFSPTMFKIIHIHRIIEDFCTRKDIPMLVCFPSLFQRSPLQVFFPREGQLLGDHTSFIQEVPQDHQCDSNCFVFVVEES